jgi:transposase-like protein
MSKIIFTKEQIAQLLNNEHVVRVGKTIVYSKDFKIKAVKLYNEQGLSSSEIFRQAGFNLNVIGKQKSKDCLKSQELEKSLQTKRRSWT